MRILVVLGGFMLQNGLTEKEVDYLKSLLIEEKNRLALKDIVLSEEFNVDIEDRSDEVDHANADVQNAERLRLRNREIFYAKKIASALDRIKRAEFGACQECGDPVRFERLRARPTAELCINCKEESERDELTNVLTKQSKSLGRAINLVGAI